MKKLNLTPNKILLANLWTNKSKRILKRKDKKKKTIKNLLRLKIIKAHLSKTKAKMKLVLNFDTKKVHKWKPFHRTT